MGNNQCQHKQCVSPCVLPRLCVGLLNHLKLWIFIRLLFRLCSWKYTSSFLLYCNHIQAYSVTHTHTHTHPSCQSRRWYMQTLLLSLSLNLLSGVRHIIVFMARRIYTEIFHLHILWKSHLFSTAICKYSTMNLVNCMNHSVFAGCCT